MMKTEKALNGRNLTKKWREHMDETKTYIVEIPQVLGDETTIYLETVILVHGSNSTFWYTRDQPNLPISAVV